MRRTSKCIAAAITALLAVLPMGNALTASATTPDDVIAAAYAAGWPDWLVQQAISMYAGGNYTSEQCDKAIAQIYQYDENVASQIEEQFGIAPPSNMETTTPAEGSTESSTEAAGTAGSGSSGTSSGNTQTETETPSASRPTDKEFVNMTLEEKKEYLNSMPQEEKEAFVNTMTNQERNSVIKQLSASDKAAIISNFMEVGEEFGISFNIDELSDDNLQISAHDEEGKLVNVTSMGITIDPEIPKADPALRAGLLVLSVGGMIFLTRKSRQED